jgi:abequosyltransferase
MLKQLSICIPVYNCAQFLGEALESILPQAGAGVEVIVYDGGSTDETPSIMEGYVASWPLLQYHRGDHRGGIDADMAKCAEFASGEYIWLFSGDDVMRQGGIGKALRQLASGLDVYLCEHTICNRNMEFLRPYPVLSPNQFSSANLSDPIARLHWFGKALTTEAFFSFMSSLIVRREKWESGKLLEEFNGSCWGHVARLFHLIPTGLRVCYVADTWLDQRGDNDSFADKGVVNRIRIAVEGYHSIGSTFFGDKSEEAFHLRRVIRNEFGLRKFLHAKHLCKKDPKRESRVMLEHLINMVFCDSPATDHLIILIYRLPIWNFGLVPAMYRLVTNILKTIRHIGHD